MKKAANTSITDISKFEFFGYGLHSLSRDIKRMSDSGLFYVFVVVVCARGAGFFQQIGLARLLTKDELGLVVYVLRILSIASIFTNFGMGSGVLKFSAETIDVQKQKEVYKTGLFYSLFISFFVCIVYFVLIQTTKNIIDDVALYNLLALGIFYVFMVSISQIPPLYLQSIKRIKDSSKFSFYLTINSTALVLIGAYYYGSHGVVTSLIISSSVSAFVFLFYTRGHWIGTKHNYQVFNNVFKFSFFSMLANFSGILNAALGILLLRWLGFSYGEVAIYGVASTVVNAIRLAPQSLMRTAFPYLVSSKSNPKAFSAKINELVKKQGAVVGVLALLVSTVGYWLIPALFGSQYADSYPTMVILSLMLFFWAIGAPYGHAHMAMDLVKVNFLISIVQLSSNAALAFCLIPRYGSEGAAAALCASYIIQYVLLNVSCRRNLRLAM